MKSIFEFHDKWGEPCESCLHFYDNGEGQLRREAIRPLLKMPGMNPISRYVKGMKICHDCAYAEGMIERHGLSMDQARIAVANDRQEKMRLPDGSHLMGLPGLVAAKGELEAIWDWLDANVADEGW